MIEDDEVPLDEWIARLNAYVADPPAGADLAEPAGLLGAAYVERYQREPDETSLLAAIAEFGRALARAPRHEQVPYWHWGLGICHAERARLGDEPADHEGAVGHLMAAYRGWPAVDADRDGVADDLVDAIWQRFLWRCAAEENPETAAEHRDEALTALDVVRQGGVDSGYARMLLGVLLLDRYDYGGQTEQDLDRGVAVLAEALAELSPDTTPHYAFASAELVAAHLETAGLREDRTSVEQAITVADRALPVCDPDSFTWVTLHRHQAEAYAMRWGLDAERADLDTAVARWRTVCARDPDPAFDVALAELLHETGIDAGDLDLLAEAVALLEKALPSVQRPGPVWRQLGETHLARWQLASAPETLDAAIRCLDHAVAEGGPTDEAVVAQLLRLKAANKLLDHEIDTYPEAVPPSLPRLREILNEGDQLLDDLVATCDPKRAAFAACLLLTEFAYVGELPDHLDLPRQRRLFAVAGAPDGDLPPDVLGTLAMAESIVQQLAEDSASGQSPDRGLHALLRAHKDEAFTLADGNVARLMLPVALQARAVKYGDLRSQDAGRSLAQALAQAYETTGKARLDLHRREMDIALALAETLTSGSRGAAPGLRRMIGRALALRRDLVAARMKTNLLDPLIRIGQDLLILLTGEGEVRPQSPTPLPPGPLSHTVFVSVLTGGVQIWAGSQRGDLPLLRRWAAHLADAAGRLERGHIVRVTTFMLAAKAELVPALMVRDRRAAARAVDLLEQAKTEVGADGTKWTILMRDLAYALRLAGDPDRARTRRLGLAALHGHARRVLLQAGTDHAMETAREAATDATAVVRWCLQDQADDDLVAALDAGRGLVLQAVTASRTVADLLDAAGQGELATQWRQTSGLGRDQLTGEVLGAVATAGEIPDDLRLRVISTLDAEDLATRGPLAQARSGEIGATLTTLGADALVYLVPAAHPVPGLAVIVSNAGEVDLLELPELGTGDGAPVRRLLRAALGAGLTGPEDRSSRNAGSEDLSLRDAGPVGGSLPPSARSGIDDLCRWAWRAAMRPLVARLGQSRAPRRVVLVPMGLLGLVPWHAAYQETPSGRRYAVHDLVISYTPSARLLGTAAAQPVRPVRSALIVGDPLGDLPFAGVEARAIHRRFHPEGRYLGGPDAGPDRTARRDAVLDWVRAAGAGPSLLHLACHGRIDPVRPADSHLLLADGRLPARELVEVSRLAALELGQVFLAACTTNLAGGLPDEAFSLASVFLAAGAQTVFGSLWSVPDVGTSLLMYLVHHHLYVKNCPPAEALHRAQLWMLDPDRSPPEGMPAELATQCARPDNADPLAWAAFTHLGR